MNVAVIAAATKAAAVGAGVGAAAGAAAAAATPNPDYVGMAAFVASLTGLVSAVGALILGLRKAAPAQHRPARRAAARSRRAGGTRSR